MNLQSHIKAALNGTVSADFFTKADAIQDYVATLSNVEMLEISDGVTDWESFDRYVEQYADGVPELLADEVYYLLVSAI